MFPIPDNNNTQTRYLTYEQMNLINTFRGLNLDLAILGRMMVTAIVRDSPCSDATFCRTMQIPLAAYSNFGTYYGSEPAQQVCNLMSQNIILMRSLTEALMERDEQRATHILGQWNENIGLISNLLASLNPYWVREQWYSLLSRYIKLNYQQIMALLTDECEISLNIFDRIKALMVLIGDYQARGIMWGLTEPSIGQPAEQAWNDAYM